MRIESFSSWAELKLFVDQCSATGEFIWRGQSDSSWQLASSLYRFFEQRSTPIEQRTHLEGRVLDTFRLHFMRRKEFAGLTDDIASHLVMLQHYGCPTRLMDWTWSPYIAAYFSLVDIAGTGALYGLNITEYQKALAPRLPLDDYDHGIIRSLPDRVFRRLVDAPDAWPVPVWPKTYTNREHIQQSVFLLDPRLDRPTEDVLKEVPDGVLTKATMPRSVQTEAVLDLRAMNINGYHLFRGREGVALEAREALWGRQHGESVPKINPIY